jgi:hypothetical protein
MGVVMPHGVLFRGSTEGEIRKRLLQEDLIEAVVGLPSNLFYGTGIPAAILAINRDKPAGRKRKVLFIEASREFREGSNQNYLRDEDVEKIAKTGQAFEDVERYARVVPVEEIEKNDFNLNITDEAETADAFVDRFIQEPLLSRAYDRAFGTLYTATYAPRTGQLELRWPNRSWRQSFDNFVEGASTIHFPASIPVKTQASARQASSPGSLIE